MHHFSWRDETEPPYLTSTFFLPPPTIRRKTRPTVLELRGYRPSATLNMLPPMTTPPRRPLPRLSNIINNMVFE